MLALLFIRRRVVRLEGTARDEQARRGVGAVLRHAARLLIAC